MSDKLNEILKNGIYEYLRSNSDRDTVDIVAHFNLGHEKVLSALADLKEENKVKSVWTGHKHSYVVSKS